jgi:hypothetical protein
MKVAIITFHWSDNYGALHQARSLQEVLQNRGHKVKILDYRKGTPHSKVLLMTARLPSFIASTSIRILIFFSRLISSTLKCKISTKLKKIQFEKFRIEYLNQTPRLGSLVDLRKIAPSFDLIITGSDQVWNPRFLDEGDGYFDAYLLSFLPPKVRSMSYAASMGHSDLSTMTVEWRNALSARLSNIRAISVREKSSIKLIEQLCGRRDAVQVLDPTLLLPAEAHSGMTGSPHKGNYLFSYMLHGLGQTTLDLCTRAAHIHRLCLVRCDAKTGPLIDGFVLPDPTGWLRQIRGASFVVTNSFHGVVFCLIFHVPFAAILIENEMSSMNSRIMDLLYNVGLTHRIMKPDEEISETMFRETIDWNSVDDKVDEMRIQSIAFLENQGL